jgi:hypothetical protein
MEMSLMDGKRSNKTRVDLDPSQTSSKLLQRTIVGIWAYSTNPRIDSKGPRTRSEIKKRYTKAWFRRKCTIERNRKAYINLTLSS